MPQVEVNGFLYDMSEEDAERARHLLERVEYLDKRQYAIKIQLNSLYGALSNPHFRFFDPRLGNSTTGTGRFVLEHMAKYAGQYFDGTYEYPNRSSVYGDTDSSYFLTHEDTVEGAIRAADDFATSLNATMSPFMAETFGCYGDWATQIKVAREVVADRCIFVKKKMYMMHVVDIKGKTTDKMKVMGLMIKKTQIPKPIAKAITTVVERYLRGVIDWNQFRAEIVGARESIMNGDDIKPLGRPISVKDMSSFSDSTDNVTRKGSRVAGHVRAAVLYNRSLRVFGDKENEPIASGTKIRTYKLKSPENGIKAIALPTDVEPIPEWFLEYYLPKIDLNQQMMSLFDSPINQILSALDKVVPTRNDIINDECLEF